MVLVWDAALYGQCHLSLTEGRKEEREAEPHIHQDSRLTNWKRKSSTFISSSRVREHDVKFSCFHTRRININWFDSGFSVKAIDLEDPQTFTWWIYCRKHVCWLSTSFKSCSHQLVAFLASEPTFSCIRDVSFCTAIWFDYQTFWFDVHLRTSYCCKTIIKTILGNFLFNNYWWTLSRTYFFLCFEISRTCPTCGLIRTSRVKTSTHP